MKLLGTFLIATSITLAQAPKSFDVATIKPAAQPLRPGPHLEGDRFLYNYGTVMGLILYAYEVESFQVSGAPSWSTQDVYDIQASAGSGVPLTEPLSHEMLRSLLAERFGLRMHRESKEMDVLRLVTNGTPKLKLADRKSAGFLLKLDGAETKGASMAELARMVQRFAGRDRPVVDRSGLTGSYEFDLTFAATRSPAGEAAPDIVTALREQLNLKLETGKELLDVWIVDAVAKPSAN
jgi:uncharacterized protein (TIGR03435 family)